MEGLVGFMQWRFLCHVIQHALSHEQNRQEHVCAMRLDVAERGYSTSGKGGSRS